MAPPATSRTSATLTATRQQLDELEALLQKMLQLPVTGGDGPPVAPEAPSVEPAPAVEVRDESAEASLDSLTLSQPIIRQPAGRPAPPAPLWKSPEVGAVRGISARPGEAFPGSAPRSADTPTAEDVLLPWGWGPLVGVNSVFEWATYSLGPLGRGLRHPAGRAVLGSVGILAVIGAAAWCALVWWGWIR